MTTVTVGGRRSLSVLLAMAIVITGLAGKAAVDKALALQGGADAVGLLGQIGSLAGLLSGVSLSGLGADLEGFPLPTAAALMFLLGDWLRVYAWIWLNGLFARGYSVLVAVGGFFVRG